MLLALIAAHAAGGEVALARHTLYPGEVIEAAAIRPVDDPNATLGVGCLDAANAAGRVPHRVVFAGTCVREPHLLPRGTGAGPAGLVPEGHTLIRLAVPGLMHVDAMTRVDAIVLADERWCVGASDVTVLGVETKQDLVSTRPVRDRISAVHLAIPSEDAPRFENVEPAHVELALRAEVETSTQGPPRCATREEVPAGKSLVFEFPSVPARVDLFPDNADLEQLREDLYVVWGHRPGTASLTATFEGSTSWSWAIAVGPPANRSDDEDRITVAVDKEVTIELPRVAAAMSVGDLTVGALVDEGRVVRIRGLRPGITDLVLVFSGRSTPVIYEVDVTPMP